MASPVSTRSAPTTPASNAATSAMPRVSTPPTTLREMGLGPFLQLVVDEEVDFGGRVGDLADPAPTSDLGAPSQDSGHRSPLQLAASVDRRRDRRPTRSASHPARRWAARRRVSRRGTHRHSHPAPPPPSRRAGHVVAGRALESPPRRHESLPGPPASLAVVEALPVDAPELNPVEACEGNVNGRALAHLTPGHPRRGHYRDHQRHHPPPPPPDTAVRVPGPNRSFPVTQISLSYASIFRCRCLRHGAIQTG